jgi:DNA-binding LacI/PurR family transcriptional regulator
MRIDLPERARPPTIRDVAERARTSIATVSYALGKKQRYLRPELRERVLQAAQELGYVRNAAASSLRGLRRGLLAVLVPQFGNNFFTRICVEAESVAQHAGFVVTICNSNENPALERSIIQRLIAQRIDGCIVSPALSATDNIALLRRDRVPTVVLERSLGDAMPDHDFVGHDNFQSGFLATQQLLAAGHRRIAFLGWDSPIPNIHDRARGYRAALAGAGVESDPAWLLLDALTQEGGARMATRLATLPVTAAVIAHHHDLAKGALLGLMQAGRVWPDDLSLVLIGTPDWRDLVRPSLACVERPEPDMGREAARMLLRKLGQPEARHPAQILPNTFLHGGSIRPIGKGKQ